MCLVPIVLALPPGLIDSPGDGVKVITLGAADQYGHMASFSGSGPTRDDRIKPDVVAPGVDIIFHSACRSEEAGLCRCLLCTRVGHQPLYTGSSRTFCPALAGKRQSHAGRSQGGYDPRSVKAQQHLGEEYEEYYQGAGLSGCSSFLSASGERYLWSNSRSMECGSLGLPACGQRSLCGPGYRRR